MNDAYEKQRQQIIKDAMRKEIPQWLEWVTVFAFGIAFGLLFALSI